MKTTVGDGRIAKCPFCGCEYLHHIRVDVFDREEDQEKGLHVTAWGEYVQTDTDLSDNPSSRRNGVLIYFKCEECSRTFSFSIAQHKGHTFLNYHEEK